MTNQSFPLYLLTQHNGYWAQVMQSDIAKGWTAQRACNEAYQAILLMGRGPDEALQVTTQAAYWAGISPDSVKW